MTCVEALTAAETYIGAAVVGIVAGYLIGSVILWLKRIL